MRRQMLALVLVVAGCADNRETIFVRQVQVPDDNCVVPPAADNTYRTGGVLDVAYQGSYVMTPLVENQMISRADPESLRVESNGIQIDGAIVRIYETSDPNLPPEETAPVLEFFSYASSYVEPQSRVPTAFTVIPPEYTASIYSSICGFAPGNVSLQPNGSPFPDGFPREDLVLVGSTVQGITNGGLAVESPEFYFPISVCCACLLSCSADADSPEVVGLDCCGTDEVSEPPCHGGQDQAVDCRLTRGSGDPLLNYLSRCGAPTCNVP